MTNFEKINAMSVEEMAEFMRCMMDCVSCSRKMIKGDCSDEHYYNMCKGNYNQCHKVCAKWLQAEAD